MKNAYLNMSASAIFWFTPFVSIQEVKEANWIYGSVEDKPIFSGETQVT